MHEIKTRVSVVMLSWDRLQNLDKILANLQDYPNVDEIIVWNNNPNYHFVGPEKVTVINSSTDMGLFTRFAAASLAKNDAILFHDDDLLVDSEVFQRLLGRYEKAKTKAHGLFGRIPIKGQYNTQNAWGEVPITLTRFTLCPRSACVKALSHWSKFRELGGVPLGNGEDIVLSLAALSEGTNSGNFAYQEPVMNFGESDDKSIHRKFAQHVEHRTKVITLAKQLFKINL